MKNCMNCEKNEISCRAICLDDQCSYWEQKIDTSYIDHVQKNQPQVPIKTDWWKSIH